MIWSTQEKEKKKVITEDKRGVFANAGQGGNGSREKKQGGF